MDNNTNTISFLEHIPNLFIDYILKKPVNLIIFVSIVIILIVLYVKRTLIYDSIVSHMTLEAKNKIGIKALYWVFAFFSSTFFTVIVTIICPYLIDCYNSKINIIVILWMICLFLNAFSASCIKKKNTFDKWLLVTLNKFKWININTAERIFTTRDNLPKIINSINDNKGIARDVNDFYFKLDNAAQLACESIYYIIKDVTGYTNHQVTVYKRYQNKNGTNCPKSCPLKKSCNKVDHRNEWAKMIACYNKNGKKSMSFDQEHCFEYFESQTVDNAEYRKKHFYIHFFQNNITQAEILTGKKKIVDGFLFHRSSQNREEKIEQYVGIPLYHAIDIDNCTEKDSLTPSVDSEICNQQHVTYALIQIDFEEKGIIGKTEQSIKQFTETILGGIVSFLDTSLQVEEMTKHMLIRYAQIADLSRDAHEELARNYNELLNRHNKDIDDYNKNVDDYNELVQDYKELSQKKSLFHPQRNNSLKFKVHKQK